MDGHGCPRVTGQLETVSRRHLDAAHQQGIEGGFATPPEESMFDVYKSMP
jgi:hypothetical protein